MADQLSIVLFTRPPLPDWIEAIKRELSRRGHSVTISQEALAPDQFDCGFIRVLPEDHFATNPDYWLAAIESEQAGLPLLNSTESRLISADKLAVFSRFAAAGLPTPQTWPLSEQDFPLVCKPVSGSRGDGVVVLDSLQDAYAHQLALGRDCLLQQIVDQSRCIRVIASPDEALCAYDKQADGQFVLSVSMGAERKPTELTDEIATLASSMVSAIGADLCGCDILEDKQGRLWALEINASFAFDANDKAVVKFYADQIELSAARPD